MAAAITDYKLISTDEEYERLIGNQVDDWSTYPANRRSQHLLDVGAPAPDGVVFIRTGGNALQAVPRELVENEDKLISVVVPEGREPGEEILVACPFVSGRLISVIIPQNATAGSAFLVRAPPIVPEIVTGIPVNFSSDSRCQTPVVSGTDIFAQDELALQEEDSPTQNAKSKSKSTTDPDEEEYEMVDRGRFV